MSNLKLSQTALYEVLVSEVESLKNTKRAYDKVLKEVNGHLNRLEALYKEPIAVDIVEMRAEHKRIQSTLARGLYIPDWLAITCLCLVLGLFISLFFNYRQHITSKEQLAYIGEANGYIEELQGQLKNKSRK